MKSGACANGQAPACLPHPQTSTVTGQHSSLGPIGVNPAETTRCLTLRVTRGTCRAQPCASKRPSLPVQISGVINAVADPEPPAHTTASRSRTAPVVLEHDQRGLLFLTRRGSHRELVAHRPLNPTGAKIMPAPELARDRAPRGAGLRSIWSSRRGETKAGRPNGPSTERRATRPFWILMRIQKSTGNVVALSELVRRGSAVPGRRGLAQRLREQE